MIREAILLLDRFYYGTRRYRGVMTIVIPQTSAARHRRARTGALDSARFGSALQTQAADALIGPIRSIKPAEYLRSVFGKLHGDVRIRNTPLEAWASRINTLVAVYTPAFAFSIYPDKKHFWETNGRNALIWLLTIAIALWVNDDKWGLNPQLNKFMQPKVKDPKTLEALPWLERQIINRLRPDYSCFEIMKAAGLKVAEKDKAKAFWASLDKNYVDTMTTEFAKNQDEIARLIKLPLTELTASQKSLLNLRWVPSMLNRISGFKALATALQAALTVYLVGVLAMEVVFRFIAPHDKDFDASKFKKMKAMKNGKQKTSNGPASIHQPVAFQPLFQQSRTQPKNTPGRGN